MKTLFRILAAALITATALSCEKEPAPDQGGDNSGQGGTIKVTSVTLNVETLSLAEGDVATLTATVLPANATNKAVKWSSDTPAVATVDNYGLVTAVAPGTAVVTATAGDQSASVTVTVTEAVVVKSVFTDLVKNYKEESAGTYSVELPLGKGYTFAGAFDFRDLFTDLPATATFALAPVEQQNSEVTEYYESLTGNLAADGKWTRNERFAEDLNVNDEFNANNGVRILVSNGGALLYTINFYIVDPIVNLERSEDNGHVRIKTELFDKLAKIYGHYGGVEMEYGGSTNWQTNSLKHGAGNDLNLALLLNDVTNFADQGPYFSGNDPDHILFTEWPYFTLSGTNGEEIFFNDTKNGKLALSEYGAHLCCASKGIYWRAAWEVYVNCANWQLPEAERPVPAVGSIAEGAPINGVKDYVENGDLFKELVGIYITEDGHIKTTESYKGAGCRFSPRLEFEYDYGYACVSTRYMFMLFLNRRWAAEGEIGDVTLGSN